MSNKVFYMPYDPGHSSFVFTQYEYGSLGGEDMNKLQKDIDFAAEKGKVITSVWYRPGVRDPFMSSLNTDQIYVRGHGMPGFRSIEGGRGGERITYTTLADRLIASGLKKTYSGKLKLYNCHSAEEGKPGTDPECVGPAFARLVADEMYSRGYKSCTYYGYIGSIDSFAKDGSQGKHHYVRETVKGQSTEVARASDLRVQFKPQVKIRNPGFFARLFN